MQSSNEIHTIVKQCYIGIDQSLNSTGMSIQFSDKPNILFFQFASGSMKHSSSICFVNNNRVWSNTGDFTKDEINLIKSAHNQSKLIYHYLNLHCKDYEVWNIAMEGQIMSGFSSKQKFHLTDLVKLITVLQYNFLKLSHTKLKIIPPTTVKKYFTSSGRAKKEQMLEEFRSRVPNFDFTGKCDDIADSFALCEYIAHPEKRREKVKKVSSRKKKIS